MRDLLASQRFQHHQTKTKHVTSTRDFNWNWSFDEIDELVVAGDDWELLSSRNVAAVAISYGLENSLIRIDGCGSRY
jgi:hypothetical protein